MAEGVQHRPASGPAPVNAAAEAADAGGAGKGFTAAAGEVPKAAEELAGVPEPLWERPSRPWTR